jgi:predicted kinase
MNKKLIIMRGLPGSGKSTKARELAGESGIIHSTDDYLIDPVSGKYKFDPQKIALYHEMNLRAAIDSMRSGISPVVIDNTNVQKWHYEKYINAAKEYGYEVEIVAIDPTSYSESDIHELAERQKRTHNVPKEVIIDMLNKWED